METAHPSSGLRPVPADNSVRPDRPESILRCFRVVWISHTSWTVDVWADTPDDAVQAVLSGMGHDAIRIVGVIDLATTR